MIAWAGVNFVLISVCGFAFVPAWRWVWIIFLIMGLGTIPHVVIAWFDEHKRGRR